MRMLTWDSYNADTGTLTLTQSKRGANITVPTSTGLQAMLAQQHVDFGWQQYIAPVPKTVKGKLLPYSLNKLSKLGTTIMAEADLPEELTLMDLRRTAITEMVEVGVPVSSIMAMSGHTTPSSLTPYIQHTLRGASTAQMMRDFPPDLML
jgi:integrase